MGLRVQPLHPLFAAEVVGVDLARPLDDATFAELRDTFFAHAVVLVRDQALNRSVLHRGRPWDERAHRRVLRRTTVAGHGPTVVEGRIQVGV